MSFKWLNLCNLCEKSGVERDHTSIIISIKRCLLKATLMFAIDDVIRRKIHIKQYFWYTINLAPKNVDIRYEDKCDTIGFQHNFRSSLVLRGWERYSRPYFIDTLSGKSISTNSTTSTYYDP